MKKLSCTILPLLLAPALLADPSGVPSGNSQTGNNQTDNNQAGNNQLPRTVVFSETANTEGTIQNIDQTNRIVTLKGQNGNTVKIEVGEDAPNFNQLKVGDKVMAKYYQSAALSLRPPGQGVTTGTQQMVRTRGAQGQAGPSRTMVQTQQMAATVEKVDQQNRTVTVKGPEGNTVELKADENVQGFEQLKPGDQIVATFTDAIALSVERESQ